MMETHWGYEILSTNCQRCVMMAMIFKKVNIIVSIQPFMVIYKYE